MHTATKKPFTTLTIQNTKINCYEWWSGAKRVNCVIIDAPNDFEIRTAILVELNIELNKLGKDKQSHTWLFKPKGDE